MTNEEHERYYRIVTDSWRFFLQYADPVSAESYWQKALKDAATLGHKYDDDRLAVHLINAYLDYLEEKHKKAQKGKDYGKQSR